MVGDRIGSTSMIYAAPHLPWFEMVLRWELWRIALFLLEGFCRMRCLSGLATLRRSIMRRPIKLHLESVYRPSTCRSRLDYQPVSASCGFCTKVTDTSKVEPTFTTAELSNIDTAASRGDMTSLISMLKVESAKMNGTTLCCSCCSRKF